jgi:hypothetical protein
LVALIRMAPTGHADLPTHQEIVMLPLSRFLVVCLAAIGLAIPASKAASMEPPHAVGFVHICGGRPGLGDTARLYGVANTAQTRQLRDALTMQLQRACARARGASSVWVAPPARGQEQHLFAARP